MYSYFHISFHYLFNKKQWVLSNLLAKYRQKTRFHMLVICTDFIWLVICELNENHLLVRPLIVNTYWSRKLTHNVCFKLHNIRSCWTRTVMQISGRGFRRLTQTVRVVLRVNALKCNVLRWALDFQEISSFYEKTPGEDE